MGSIEEDLSHQNLRQLGEEKKESKQRVHCTSEVRTAKFGYFIDAIKFEMNPTTIGFILSLNAK